MHVFGRSDGSACKFDYIQGCDPFIKLFINDELKLETVKLRKKFFYDPKLTFTTAKIRRNSTIKVELWDARRGFWDYDELLFQTEGDIDSFLNEPRRQSADTYNFNTIEAVSFWQDEVF